MSAKSRISGGLQSVLHCLSSWIAQSASALSARKSAAIDVAVLFSCGCLDCAQRTPDSLFAFVRGTDLQNRHVKLPSAIAETFIARQQSSSCKDAHMKRTTFVRHNKTRICMTCLPHLTVGRYLACLLYLLVYS
eukprot:1377049-Pleurochrysis_carterae.AAC.1